MNRIIKDKQDLTHLTWTKIRNSSGTAGSFLKSYSELGGIKTYYKLSNFDSLRGVIGHECVNEIIVDRLLEKLGIPHLEYRLIHADISVNDQIYDVFLCASEDYKNPGESKIALDMHYEIERLEGETPFDFCIRSGWDDYVYEMLTVDYLILNRDRHGANIEILRNRSDNTVRPAPLFDHGLSLMFNASDDEIAADADVLEDRPVNNFIGSRSVFENLKLIPSEKMLRPGTLKESDLTELTYGLDGILSPVIQDKIREMIWKRWCVYEDICNSR